jgi:hypothetical protein
MHPPKISVPNMVDACVVSFSISEKKEINSETIDKYDRLVSTKKLTLRDVL